jgi:hypothetical protein
LSRTFYQSLDGANNSVPGLNFGVAPIMGTSLETTTYFKDGSSATSGLPGQSDLLYDPSQVAGNSYKYVTQPTGDYGFYISQNGGLPDNYGQTTETQVSRWDVEQQQRISYLLGTATVLSSIATDTEGTLPETLTADTEGAFNYYMRQAQTLDVSTGPNQAVFYSGPGNRALAEQFAEQNGKLTLEKTQGGSWLDQQGLFNPDSPLTREQAGQVWSTISQRFAQGASGNAVGFVNGARAGSIFNTVEYPTLLNNPSIVNVITGGH